MRRMFFFFGVVLSGLFLAGQADAAILKLSPAEQIVRPGDTVIVHVQLDSDVATINAVQGYVTYPADLLEPIELSRGGSFLSLWPEEPEIKPAGGAITFSGGIPGGTIAWNGQILRITFMARGAGTAALGFMQERSGVYLNDGHGTPAALATEGATVFIESLGEEDIRITSSTHPDQNAWYREGDAAFVFPVRNNADYAYTILQDPLADPVDIPKETNGSIRYENLQDGIWYFALQERPAGEDWGAVMRYRVKIDSTPPEPFSLERVTDFEGYDGKTVLLFNTSDALSGIARYEVDEGGVVTDDAMSPHVLTQPEPYPSVVVRAYDVAGNVRAVYLGGAAQRVFLRLNFATALLLLAAAVLGFLLFLLIRSDDE